MAEYAFEICYVEGRQNVHADYLSRSVGEIAVKEDEEEKHVIEQYFCKHVKEGLETITLVATIGSNQELKDSSEIISDDLVSVDGTRAPVRFRRQAE